MEAQERDMPAGRGRGDRGRSLAVIEDVITSGGQVIESCRALHEQGAQIAAVLCVIDRHAGGAANLAAEGLELRVMLTISDLGAYN